MNVDLNIIEISIIAGGLILGLIVGFILAGSRLNRSAKKEKQNLIKEAEVKAEALKQEKILQAKEKFLQLKAEHDKSVQEKLFEVLVPRYKARQGGYTQVIRLGTRLSDGSEMGILKLVS